MARGEDPHLIIMLRIPIDYINDGRGAYINVSTLGPLILNIQITHLLTILHLNCSIAKGERHKSRPKSLKIYPQKFLSVDNLALRWPAVSDFAVLTAVLRSTTI